MALNMNIVLFITVLFVHQMILGSGAIQIKISPDKCIATMENEVHISCIGEEVNNNEITLIKLYRNDEDPIAILRQCSNITHGNDSTNHFQAKGSINKDGSQSFLSVTLLNPKSLDTGIYTCVIYYIDEIGELKEEMASSQLTVERLDVRTLETVLNELKIKQNELKTNKGDEEIKELRGKLSGLEAKVMNQSQKIFELTDKATAVSAFHATCKSNTQFSRGKTLILPDILMKQGKGYDASTGKMTAPRDGLYAIHLAIRPYHGCGSDMHLKVNNKVMAEIRAYVKDQWDQSSISTVLDLKTGDEVYAVVTGGDCTLHKMYTFFSGMLIQAF